MNHSFSGEKVIITIIDGHIGDNIIFQKCSSEKNIQKSHNDSGWWALEWFTENVLFELMERWHCQVKKKQPRKDIMDLETSMHKRQWCFLPLGTENNLEQLEWRVLQGTRDESGKASPSHGVSLTSSKQRTDIVRFSFYKVYSGSSWKGVN